MLIAYFPAGLPFLIGYKLRKIIQIYIIFTEQLCQRSYCIHKWNIRYGMIYYKMSIFV